jgi:hypothetical protein
MDGMGFLRCNPIRVWYGCLEPHGPDVLGQRRGRRTLVVDLFFGWCASLPPIARSTTDNATCAASFFGVFFCFAMSATVAARRASVNGNQQAGISNFTTTDSDGSNHVKPAGARAGSSYTADDAAATRTLARSR